MRILLIEDEIKLAQAIKTGLEQEGIAVDQAHDGEIGYDLALDEDYDLIILDLMLPKMKGQDICLNLRHQGNETPILMLTALSELSDKVDGLNMGADDYLTKPFEFEELLARAKALTRRKSTRQTVLQVADLKLDTISYLVTRGERQIQLSKKEFALLEYMLRNKDKVISKDQIITHVWDFDADVLPNTVEVMVGNLRKKIDSSSPKLIHTVRGFGYKIGE